MTSLLERLSTPHLPGELLAALNPRWGSRLPGGRLTGVIERIEPTGRDAAAVTIRPAAAWKGHRPGQFVTVGVDVDGVRHHRCFSLTSLPDLPDGTIEVTVQAHDGGTVSPHLVHRARPGDVVQLSPAEGDFTLPQRLDAPVLLVSAGSGITPLVSMLRWLAAEQLWRAEGHLDEHLDVVVLHHATAAARVLHGRELEALAAAMPWLRLDTAITRDEAGRPVAGSHLDAASLDRRCPDWRERDAWVCGPEGLLAFAAGHWADGGVAGRLHVESFHPAATLGAAAPTIALDGTSPATATFAHSGLSVAAETSAPLLDVAEAAGLCPPSGCRMGICHTCSTRLDSGIARDLRDGRLVTAGEHVQLCVSAAATDLVLDLRPLTPKP